MGLIDRLTSGEDDPLRREEPYQPEEYGYEDFSDDVKVWVVDTWPSNKPLIEYDLMFIEDENLKDPVILNCPSNFPMLNGTKILGYDDAGATVVEGVTFHVLWGKLVHPHVVEACDFEGLFDIPEPMDGREIEATDGTDLELVRICLSVLGDEAQQL